MPKYVGTFMKYFLEYPKGLEILYFHNCKPLSNVSRSEKYTKILSRITVSKVTVCNVANSILIWFNSDFFEGKS